MNTSTNQDGQKYVVTEHPNIIFWLWFIIGWMHCVVVIKVRVFINVGKIVVVLIVVVVALEKKDSKSEMRLTSN
tara:strand:+ start:101 stop:322 length:222 start_codon:yes stop_codon:yes gene_type:complete